MKSASYLLLYVPICLVVMLVLEACRTDDYGRVFKRAAQNFGTLTLVLVVAGALVWVVNKYL
ncbi:MAG TPA: hypothetical protein VF950_16155 [Planctomycetota bacterium]